MTWQARRGTETHRAGRAVASFDADQIRRDNPLAEYLAKRGVVLRKNGQEWTGCCPFHAEDTPSFTVYPGRNGHQQFHCFGCDAKGDVIGFVERWDSTDFKGACEILGGEREATVGLKPAPPAAPAVDIYAAWTARLPGEDAPPIESGERTPMIVNPKRPDRPSPRYTPTAVYPYRMSDGRLIGYVLRVEIKGRKLTPLILWCQHAETGELTWCHRPFTGPRRLYNLPAFAARPDAQVLVVEGEKCADAAARLLPKAVATTWQGGGKAVGKSDWSPVRGRDVLIWPDNDAEGLKAAQEAGRLASEAGAARVRIIDPPQDAAPVGWDIADAEAEGWDKARVLAYAKARARPWRDAPDTTTTEPPAATSEERRSDEPPPEQRGERKTETKPALKPLSQEKAEEDPQRKAANVVPIRKVRDNSDDWMRHLELDQNNRPIPKIMTNIVGYLQHHPAMVGVIAKDVFANQIVLTKRPPWDKSPGEWQPRQIIDADAVAAVKWLDRPGMKTGVANVNAAITLVAEENKYDPALEYFEALKWDGIPRLHTGPDGRSFLERYMGAKPTSSGIERAFGMRWLISAVSRNLTEERAGEKVDTMLVLEGRQGMMKSTALEVLATLGKHRFFTSGVNDIASKDGIMQMQGSVIVEFDELSAINKADTETIKGFLSRRVDKIRLPYERQPVNLPRRFVCAGTMNPRGLGYLKDPTGARRFWPVFVQQPADIEALAADRDQLWAEAVHLYRIGEPWWLQGDEVAHAEVEQRKRFQADPWADLLDEWLATVVGPITVSTAFRMLNVPMHLRTDAAQQRILGHLVANGYVRTVKKHGNGKLTVFVKADAHG